MGASAPTSHMPILAKSLGKNVRHIFQHKVLRDLNNAIVGGTTGQVWKKNSAADYDASWQAEAGGAANTAVSVDLVSNAEFDPAADHNGSGTAWDRYYPNLLWHLADGAAEGESGTYTLWCTEVDDPSNPTTQTVIWRGTLANQNDLEALSFVQMADGLRLLVWENTGDTVRGYPRPDVVPGQTLVTAGAQTADFGWSPSAGLDTNVESMRWNEWDGMLYFLSPRGAGGDDNDNARSLWRSADWRTATAGALPATTITKVGEVVTRPEGSSPVPNANGDIDFFGEHVLMIAGVASGTESNNYVMYVAKDTDQDWSDVIPTGQTNFPSVLTKTARTAGHECIAVHKPTGVIWVGPEARANTMNVINAILNEGDLQFPTSSNNLPTSTAENKVLISDDAGGWQEIEAPEIMVEAFAIALGTVPDAVTDWGPVIRRARDHGDATNRPYTLKFGTRAYAYSTTETISVQDGETGSSSNFEVGCRLPQGCRGVGAGSGHGRSGGDNGSTHAPTVIFYDGTTLHDAIFLLYTDDGNPDWRGGGLSDMHLKDKSTNRDRVLHGVYSQGANFQIHERLSISHIERTGGWGFWVDVVRNAGNTEDEPTQYGTMDKVNIWRCDNSIRIDGRNPDWKLTNGSCLRDGGETPVAGKYGIYAATNKLSITNYEIQFHETELYIHNHGASLGKHITLINVHFEADTAAAANSYNACVEMIGTNGQDELPLFIACEVGNGSKYTDYFKFTDVTGFRIRDFRIRDNDWLAAADTKIEHTNSTGTVDGVSV